MTGKVIYLHGKPREIAQVTRVGFREHGPCEQLLSANKLAGRRFVLEAATAGMREFFDVTRTSRQLFGCSDPSCCGDVDKMLRHPAAHLAVQAGRLVKALSETPEANRAEQFLETHLKERAKIAGRAIRIRNMDDSLRRKIGASAKRLELAYDALSGLYDRMGKIDFPVEAKFRSGSRQTELFQERSS